MDNKPVEACPPSAIYRTRKFVQRNKGFAAAAAAVSVVLLGGIVGTSGVTVWGLNEKVHAEQQAIRANALATELEVQKEEIKSKSLVLLEAVSEKRLRRR